VTSIVHAGGFRSPEECQAYTGEAHLNCLYAYIEIQQSKIGKVEEELKAQKGMLGQLSDQVTRQSSISEELQRRLSQSGAGAPPAQPPAYVAPPLYPGYIYGPGYYPPPGLSFYLGGPGYYYGLGYYGPRFFGPHFFHHCRGPWGRC
jgi:hypothetical protein